jgi:hypothetical protein
LNVRNFWIDASIDGRETTLSGGPKGQDGGFNLVVSIREHGRVVEAVRVEGWATEDGKLNMSIQADRDLLSLRNMADLAYIQLETDR